MAFLFNTRRRRGSNPADTHELSPLRTVWSEFSTKKLRCCQVGAFVAKDFLKNRERHFSQPLSNSDQAFFYVAAPKYATHPGTETYRNRLFEPSEPPDTKPSPHSITDEGRDLRNQLGIIASFRHRLPSIPPCHNALGDPIEFQLF